MSRLFKGISLKEGFNNIGTQTVDITFIEIENNATSAEETNIPVPSRSNTFQLRYLGHEEAPYPANYKAVFTLNGLGEEFSYSYEKHTTEDGFFGFDFPILPIIKGDLNPVTGILDLPVNLKINGQVEEVYENVYVKVITDASEELYTLITDIVLHNGYLSVFNGTEVYYKLIDNIAIGNNFAAVYVTKLGQIYGYNSLIEEWEYIHTLSFFQVQFPGELTLYSDGFYQTNGNTGVITDGNLGYNTFEKFSAEVISPVPYYFDLGLKVFDPNVEYPIYDNILSNVFPGDKNIRIIHIDQNQPEIPEDISPSIYQIEDLIGFTFSPTFLSFLQNGEYTSLNRIRKAGPIQFIVDFPEEGVTAPELRILQAHTDLYTIHDNIEQNQRLIDFGFDSIYGITNTPKNEFVNAVSNQITLPLFTAAQIHEVATQKYKLLGNILAGRLADMRMEHETYQYPQNSTFGEHFFANFANKCECDDCKSGVSPFAYMVDLIKFGAARITKTSVPAYDPNNPNMFISFLTDYFHQEFGRLSVDCETLHDEFCRVRLVTEVLEKVVLAAGTLPTQKALDLAQARKQYIELTYLQLLTQAGTSYNEVRKIVAMQPDNEEKRKAASNWAEKLGVPLHVLGSSPLQYTVERVWLTVGSSDPAQELNAENLELIFGFRDTQRDVLTSTPDSLMAQWQQVYLRQTWHEQDYQETAYSREGLNPADPNTFKHHWKPIIDPDIIGLGDMAYNIPVHVSGLWRHRMEDTNKFITDYINNSAFQLNTSADIKQGVYRAMPDRDISTDDILHNFIKIDSIDYSVASRSLQDTYVDFIIDKSSLPWPILQPTAPVLSYTRVVEVTLNPSVLPNYDFIIQGDVTENLAVTSAKLRSTGDTTVYDTNTPGALLSIITSTGNEGELTLSPDPSSNFLDGIIYMEYDISVPLFITTTLNSEDIVYHLFNTPVNYDEFFNTGSTFIYSVWTPPSSWPGGVTGTEYECLKKIYNLFSAGLFLDEITVFIQDDLHLTPALFNRMMQLFIKCEDFIAASLTTEPPTEDEIYELGSIFRVSARRSLQAVWVQEEIETDGTEPPILLSKQWFWESANAPLAGIWDSRLQTLPEIPIIDPELVTFQQLLIRPDTNPYRGLYDTRVQDLDSIKQDFIDLLIGITPNNSFEQILNKINTNSVSTPYTIPGYSTLSDLLDDLNSSESFLNKKAAESTWVAFGMDVPTFLQVIAVKDAFESNDINQRPSVDRLKSICDSLTTAYKIQQLYQVWIPQEISLFVEYYNVLNLRMDPIRGDYSERAEWQRTLRLWNRQPVIDPDIVPIENIKNFVIGNAVHDIWLGLKGHYAALALDIENIFSGTSLSTQKANYDLILSTIIARTEVIESTADLLPYFVAIAQEEEKGVGIRPILAQYGISITEYRTLRNVYDVLQVNPTLPLLNSEYEDIRDIFVSITKRNALAFKAIDREWNQGILLCSDEFQNYKPAITNFPLTELPQDNPWRTPYSVKKEWKDLLESRNDREKSVKDEWNELLTNVEEVTMPVMRDALIKALMNSCESLDAAKERLAKTYFMETKDNCCVKHSRVSFAIETLQSFYFALHNGIFDEYAANIYITAPEFDKEWEWIGSYATWRSAVLVYVYPENLLYPTLKKYQSPAFIELAQTIQGANRFSPDAACAAAKRYESYFEDIQNLTILCTTNAEATVEKRDANGCCEETIFDQYTVFYFAQSNLSKKFYWSSKPVYDLTNEEYGFWEELPLTAEKGTSIKFLGAFVLSDTFENQQATNKALWVFYSYRLDGELKIAYITKSLIKPNSEWSEPVEAETEDLPSYISDVEFGYQHDLLWDIPSFVFKTTVSTVRTVNGLYTYKYGYVHYRYNIKTGKFVEPIVFHSDSKFVVGIRMQINAHGFCMINVYEDSLQAKILGTYFSVRITSDGQSGSLPIGCKIIGAFEQKGISNHILIVYKDSGGLVQVLQVEFGLDASGLTVQRTTDLPLNTDSDFQSITKIHPLFAQSGWHEIGFALDAYSEARVGTRIRMRQGTLVLAQPFSLAPEKRVDVPIESADCTPDLKVRAINIKTHLRANMNAPQGNPIGSFMRTRVIQDYISEAYYFVPMLIALDQQNRGQFDPALSWYRSVYDYTASNIPRKIYYGLVMEGNVNNVFTRPSDWLLDPLNPHLIAQTRTNAYTRYTLMNIIQCLTSYADREFTMDTIETVPRARMLYTAALDLLKTSELKLKPNLCYAMSHNCMQEAVTGIPLSYTNAFEEVQNQTQSLGTISLIEEASGAIIDILNNETITLDARFAQSFEYIASVKPSPTVAPSVEVVTEGSAERSNNAYRYFLANDAILQFNTAVMEKYSAAVANISGIETDQLTALEAISSINWLEQAPIKDSEVLQFKFMSEGGQQLLKGEKAYKPLSPTSTAIVANLDRSNASTLILDYKNYYPSTYTPIIDYQFCVPFNPVYEALELKANVELFKIHNCRNIAGMVRELDIFAAPTDSTTGIPIIGAGGNLILPGLGTFAPSQYRFRTLMERAKQLVSVAQQLESQFLTTLEKADAENYSQLRARQDLQTAKATVKLQNLRVTQAGNELALSKLQVEKVEVSQTYFTDLINSGWSGYEISSITLLTAATVTQAIATSQFFAAGAASFSTFNYGSAFGHTAQGTASIAQVLSMSAGIMSQIASYERRAQEWKYQLDLTEHDLGIANQQVKIADQNIRIVSQEREIAQLNTDHAQDTLEFLKTKFTNAELYTWIGNVLERAYSYLLSLATATAKTAESQLYFERQEQAGPFILDDYWEVASTGIPSATSTGTPDRRGITGSTRLLQDIYRLDQYAFDTNKRKLQLTKVISLVQLFPMEFQQFRETGVLNFELTDQLFDYDFPGHYLRLINNVKTSVIGLVPVNEGIKATLAAQTTSYTVIGGTIFQRVPIRRMENNQVALTGTTNATGMFELQTMADNELMNPFEGMGVESRWEFKMPKFSNRMDYNQIADILITVEYTAMDSFLYRTQVLQDLDNSLSFNRGFLFKNDFPDAWYDLKESENGLPKVEIALKREMFPAGIDDLKLDGTTLLLHFVRADGFVDEIEIENFDLAQNTSSSGKGGTTVNGTFKARALMNVLSATNSATPLVKLQLQLKDSPIYREYFKDGKITDILLLMGCKANLPNYPL